MAVKTPKIEEPKPQANAPTPASFAEAITSGGSRSIGALIGLKDKDSDGRLKRKAETKKRALIGG